ncbi:MAG: NAD-dependent deacetylase, partial [Candidatus Aminicenantes bacterium]|nr:NAD-dependent deacetylase [Candidatus Aminicenantes bacterium]
YLQCLANCSDRIWPAADLDIVVEEETMRAQPPLPVCPDCGRLARPNVLMFGDWNWLPGRSREQQRLFQNWLANSGENNLVIIECGAGTAVPSVRRLSEQLLARPRTRLIRINKNEAEVPSGQVGLAGSAWTVLHAIEK